MLPLMFSTLSSCATERATDAQWSRLLKEPLEQRPGQCGDGVSIGARSGARVG